MKILNKIRYWLIRQLLNEDEKYLLAMAVETRYNDLWKYAIEDRTADKSNVAEDIGKLVYIKSKIFSTNLYY